ncbi:POP1 [Blepharisma stoltei]|uniref:Uncharacterized protein n=1 Tax=Blepharisma stoltei TaxID=1481888 RepID=A0AAU9KNF2_9CILI|nr:unnamed protein product [Blepharisma stoltei]
MAKSSKKAKIRAKREEGEVAQIPESLQNISLPRIIDIETFREARKIELNHFLTVLSQKAAAGGNLGSKKSFQLLPKHMRRRAMSHNSYRVPARIRVAIHSAAAMKQPCRKRRRHTRTMLLDYERRNKKAIWLETHIWHAKRMKMIEKWGYKIALHPNDKSIRAVYRFASHNCVVYDRSYYISLILKDKNFIESHVKVEKKCGFHREGSIMDGEKLICPVEIIMKEEEWVIIIHPASYKEVKELLEKENVYHIDLKDKVVIYSFMGPKSTELLASVMNIKESNINEIIQDLKQFKNLAFPNGAAIGLTLMMSKKHQKIRTMPKQLCLTAETSNIIPSQPSINILKMIVKWNPSISNTPLWDTLKGSPEKSHVPQKLTTRNSKSRYPKVPKIPEKQENQPIKEAPQIEESEKMEIEEVETVNKESVEMEIEVEISENEQFEVNGILVFRKSKMARGFAEGWDLILPSGNGPEFWRTCIYSGAKAIGLRDYNAIKLEQAIPSYPDDFPTTSAYQTYAQEQAKIDVENYFKRPSSKRVNFERISMPFPFYSDWFGILGVTSYTQLKLIQIKCHNRIPQRRALLCKPASEDFIDKKGPTFQEPLSEKSKLNHLWTVEDFGNFKANLSRQVVGFITSGGFSFIKARGFGIGYIQTNYDSEITDKILFRNPKSRFYHLCEIKRL